MIHKSPNLILKSKKLIRTQIKNHSTSFDTSKPTCTQTYKNPPYKRTNANLSQRPSGWKKWKLVLLSSDDSTFYQSSSIRAGHILMTEAEQLLWKRPSHRFVAINKRKGNTTMRSDERIQTNISSVCIKAYNFYEKAISFLLIEWE